ncbi:MAG: hypothetical protein KatS3mg105_3837 [Gemmatales bacterium]|nr:MAG: hypothetical protein KatS3mg105_3837 [Gemmatales bacterium]
MADRQLVFSDKMTETAKCPPVSDLINFGLGRIGASDRKRVEAHLEAQHCDSCLRWIRNASRFQRRENSQNIVARTDIMARTVYPLSLERPVSVSDRTPIPPTAQAQRAALDDLAERLRMLEEDD